MVDTTMMSQDASTFSTTEQQILELYDQLEELKLECSLLEAQDTAVLNSQVNDVSEEALKTAQNELLESRALYSLRNNILESILMANPILKAVHAGPKASPVERDLHPLLRQRDDLSITLTNLSSTLTSTVEELGKVECEHLTLARKNAELTRTMLELAEEASTQSKEDIKDPDLWSKMDELEKAVRVSRQRWRMMKDTTSAVVVGSGVEWARDMALRKVVMEEDADDGWSSGDRLDDAADRKLD